jgi:hypothetical protein
MERGCKQEREGPINNTSYEKRRVREREAKEREQRRKDFL